MFEALKYRDLILTLVARDLRVRYRRSVLGFLWTMLQPLLTLVVYQVVFSTVFRFDIRNYPVYALAGILFYTFFSQSIVSSMNSLKVNSNILRKLPVPLSVFPITAVLAGVINLLFALLPLLLIMLVTGQPMRSSLLFLPVAILIATLFTLGAGLILSPLAVFFADVVELISVVLTMLYFLTPCFYPLKIVEGHRFFWVIRFNPVRSILETFRDPIYYGKIPPLTHLGVSCLIALVAFGVGVIVFRRSAHRIPFYI